MAPKSLQNKVMLVARLSGQACFSRIKVLLTAINHM